MRSPTSDGNLRECKQGRKGERSHSRCQAVYGDTGIVSRHILPVHKGSLDQVFIVKTVCSIYAHRLVYHGIGAFPRVPPLKLTYNGARLGGMEISP
jgi:hypothetical protein